jgi:hypothetical protein
LLGIEPISKEVLKRRWPTIAKHALSVQADDDPIKDTFAFFGLDPEDPWAWRNLAANWAYVLFRVSRAGRPSEWTDGRLCRLMREVSLRRQRDPRRRLSDRAICGHIAQDRRSPPHFRKAGAEGLPKALLRARSEKHNGILRDLIEEVTAKSNLTRGEAREIVIRAIETIDSDKIGA